MRRALPWILGIALVIGAGALTVLSPDDDAVVAPIDRRGSAGDEVASRALVAVTGEATFATRIRTDDGWEADGHWLVVAVTASAPRTEVDAAIRLATLAVDGRVFQSSERVSTSLVGAPLRVGIGTTGMLAFELPPDIDTGAAELRLNTSYFTAELDELVVIDLTLDGLPSTDAVEITRPGLVTP